MEDEKWQRHIETEVALLRQEVEKNTAITEEVAQILNTFRVAGQVAKWLAAIGSAIAAAIYAIEHIGKIR